MAAALALSVCGMSGSRGAADEPAEPPYLDLVRQLGAASFPTRERAEQRLLQIGIAAKPALLHGTRDEDLEVRLATLQTILQSSKPALLKQLLALWTESIAKDDDGGQCAYAMQLVLKYDLQESGVRLAREALEKTTGAGAVQNQAATKPYAAIVLARFGSEDDARYLVPHLDRDSEFLVR